MVYFFDPLYRLQAQRRKTQQNGVKEKSAY